MWSLLPSLLLSACGTAPAADPAPPPNLILVSIDTLRADRLGAFGNPNGLSPNLDRFAAEGARFTQAYSQAVITAPSHASFFTSRYPVEEVGSGRAPALGPDKPLLAEVLKIYGYQTAAFVGGGDLNPAMKLNVGFDQYNSPEDFASLWRSAPAALQWIDKRDHTKPFFTFIHGYDTHVHYLKPTPFGYLYGDLGYQGPGQLAVRTGTERLVHGKLLNDTSPLDIVHSSYLRNYSEEAVADLQARIGRSRRPAQSTNTDDIEFVRKIYDGAVSYADAQLGLLMVGLAERGLLENTAVMVLGDHGEQLGEYGYFNHCCGTHDEESHVPLILRLPDRMSEVPRGVVHTGLVELVDVMPTLLELAGAAPPGEARGRSLMPAARGEDWKGRDYAFTTGNDRMRSVSARGPKGRLTYTGVYAYAAIVPDLIEAASLTGPGFDAQPADLDLVEKAKMRTALVTWLRSLEPAPRQAPEELPPALREALRARGYWDVQ